MSVSAAYREFVLEQLGRVAPVSSRAMFGGVGVYADGLFFALMDDDTLYFKVDDGNRGSFEEIGSGPFLPFGDASHVMQYYRVPAELLEEPERIAPWMHGALDAARRARRRRKK